MNPIHIIGSIIAKRPQKGARKCLTRRKCQIECPISLYSKDLQRGWKWNATGFLVLFSDPTSKKERGLVNLGKILRTALRNFHAPIRSQLWHCHMTSLPQECNIAILAVQAKSHMQSCRPIRSQLCSTSTANRLCSHTDQSDPSFAWPGRHAP